MATVILRQTFRLHDNSLLEAAAAAAGGVPPRVVWAIERAMIPDYATDGDRTIGSQQFSYHTWHLMLCVAKQHFIDLSRRGCAASIMIHEPHADWEGFLLECGDILHFDQHADPAFDEMTAALRACGAQEHATRSMVDWTRHSARSVVSRTFPKPFSKLSTLKAACDDIRRSPAAPCRLGRRAVTTERAWEKWIDSEIMRVRAVSGKTGRKLFAFERFWSIQGGASCDFDQRVRAFSRDAAATIADPRWKKQTTARDLKWGWRIGGSTLENCSQVSPWIAVGCLSPLHFCGDVEELQAQLGSPATLLGSGSDQLRFREAYYAIALADTERVTFWADTPGWWGATTPKYQYSPQIPYEPALRWRDTGIVWKWANGTEPGTRGFDVSDDASELRDVGWVHHLKRHMLVDHLCNGGLCGHWLLAERWFAAVEADFDAVANRANAMWLAAVAFSTKQRPHSHFHYSPRNCISEQRTSSDRHPIRPVACPGPTDPTSDTHPKRGRAQ